MRLKFQHDKNRDDFEENINYLNNVMLLFITIYHFMVIYSIGEFNYSYGQVSLTLLHSKSTATLDLKVKWLLLNLVWMHIVQRVHTIGLLPLVWESLKFKHSYSFNLWLKLNWKWLYNCCIIGKQTNYKFYIKLLLTVKTIIYGGFTPSAFL